MKKDKLFIVLLLVSVGYITNISVTIAASTQAENKNAANSHKKNKPARNTGHQRQMSEKDITECTQLIDKVARTDKLLQSAMIAPATSSQLKKPATTQIFASDNPAAIAHLTGVGVNLATSPAPANSAPPNHNLATPTTPVPLKQVAKSTIPAGTQIFASDDPQKIAHLTGKITTPLTGSAPQVVAKKPVVHPRIQLFSPNTPDLNTLEGKSANLAGLQKTAPVDTLSKTKAKAKAKPKAKKTAHKSQKPAPAPAADANKKTEEPAPKSEKPAPAADANKKPEEPAPKSEKKPDPAAASSEKPKNSI
ncbi:MAG: hypothetical protein NTW85_08915 [Methylococcales bacterium]|nr:hypothetical protein [Methylococcales bacterium]